MLRAVYARAHNLKKVVPCSSIVPTGVYLFVAYDKVMMPPQGLRLSTLVEEHLQNGF